MHVRKVSILVACLLAVPLALWSQGQGGGGGNTSGGGNSGASAEGTRGGNTSGGGQNQNQGTFGNTNNRNDPFGSQTNDPFRNQMRPLYLQGKVLTSDGVPPSEPVVVQRVCAGNVIPEGWTDSKGRFSFDVGGDVSMITTDASVSGGRIRNAGMGSGLGYGDDCVREIGLGRFDLSSSTLRAELAGYRSTEVQLGIYSSMGKNDVGIIVLERIDGLVGHTVSALTLQAPKGARKAYETGLRELRKKKPNYDKAAKQFSKAVGEYPKFAAAWASLGDAKHQLQDLQGAEQAYSEAVKHDPKYVRPYEPLIQIAIQASNWERLEQLGSAYLELNPNSSNVQYLTAVAALNTGQEDKAEELVLAMRAGEAGDRFPQSYQIMGLIHERRAEFDRAADQYRAFVQVSGEEGSQNVQQIKRKLHEWEMLGVISKAASSE